MNEANNFTKQQFVDLLANVRRGYFVDYNPNKKFWVTDFFEEDEILVTTWKDNPFLTDLQKQYFAQLKEQAERPDASPLDVRNYNVYYLGKYSELRGKIFFESHFQFLDTPPDGLHDFRVFCDPSALRGADFFACVLSAKDKNGDVVILDVYSVNDGTREAIVSKLADWCKSYDGVTVYVEINGLVGLDFFEYAQKNAPFHVEFWNSTKNKFERICANYLNFREHLFLVRTPSLPAFMEQVYDFDEKCEHDDNADALNSAYNLQKLF